MENQSVSAQEKENHSFLLNAIKHADIICIFTVINAAKRHLREKSAHTHLKKSTGSAARTRLSTKAIIDRWASLWQRTRWRIRLVSHITSISPVRHKPRNVSTMFTSKEMMWRASVCLCVHHADDWDTYFKISVIANIMLKRSTQLRLFVCQPCLTGHSSKVRSWSPFCSWSRWNAVMERLGLDTKRCAFLFPFPRIFIFLNCSSVARCCFVFLSTEEIEDRCCHYRISAIANNTQL